ncbi:MAG TPA: RraA family protein [Bryobacteraceae bacterium]|nr:RraA family protein [Bryobacteraceae bacterium]
MVTSVPASSELEAIAALDTCTVSNAIERFCVRPRNEGFVTGTARCRFKNHPPMLGYAVTGRIRSSMAPTSGHCYHHRIDFWRYVARGPKPSVLVLQDVDRITGFGAFVGEIHASIGMALGCIGYVTNGAVRDLPAIQDLGFHLFSGSVAVSHAYAHLVDFGGPVEIGGLKISPGDLIHGDVHGVHKIPLELVGKIPQEASKIQEEERELIDFCRSRAFSVEALADRLLRASKDCP